MTTRGLDNGDLRRAMAGKALTPSTPPIVVAEPVVAVVAVAEPEIVAGAAPVEPAAESKKEKANRKARERRAAKRALKAAIVETRKAQIVRAA